MDRNVRTLEPLNGGSVYGVDTNKVLRNTYWLLSLSMLPTVLGAWIGVQTHLLTSVGPIALLLLFLGTMGLMFAIQATRNSATGVFLLLAFTFVMGLMLSNVIGFALGLANGASLVAIAFAGTAGVFFGMATLATVVKRDLTGLYGFLSVGVWAVIIVGAINLFVQSTPLLLTTSSAMIAIASLLIMVRLKAVIDGGETNYVMATLGVYVALINVFQNLLLILSILSGNDRR
jgi:FtsH-binding integral membrane protein